MDAAAVESSEREAHHMEPKKEALVLAGMCGAAVVLSVAGLAWVLMGGLGLSMDAILLLLTCLAMGGLFSLLLVWELKSAGLLPELKLPRKKETAASTPANPGESATKEEK